MHLYYNYLRDKNYLDILINSIGKKPIQENKVLDEEHIKVRCKH